MGGFEEILPENKNSALDNYPSTEMDPDLQNTMKPKESNAVDNTKTDEVSHN